LSASATPKPECGKKNSDFADRQNRTNEALLALYAAVPRQEQDLGVVEFDDLLPILRRGDWALVEIANYRVYRPTRPSSDRWGERRYAAYLLFANGRIQSKDLGDADVINAAAAKLRKLEASPTSSVDAVQRAGRELYDRTLGQIEASPGICEPFASGERQSRSPTKRATQDAQGASASVLLGWFLLLWRPRAAWDT
jgi:hypothetical protein